MKNANYGNLYHTYASMKAVLKGSVQSVRLTNNLLFHANLHIKMPKMKTVSAFKCFVAIWLPCPMYKTMLEVSQVLITSTTAMSSMPDTRYVWVE